MKCSSVKISLVIIALASTLVSSIISCDGRADRFFGESFISGRITTPVGAGLDGVTVSAIHPYGTSTAITDASGNYSIQINDIVALEALPVTIVPTLTGYSFAPSYRSIMFSGSASNQNFTAVRVYAISGTVTTSGGTGVGGITLNSMLLSSPTATATTDMSGNYLFSGLFSGTYTVTPSCVAGCTFTPPTATVNISGTDIAGIDFVINETTAPITGGALGITDTSAWLSGSYANPFVPETTVWFEFGTTAAYGNATGQSTYYSAATTAYRKITGLQPLTTYHARMVTRTQEVTFFGEDITFTTLIAPIVIATGLDYPTALALGPTSVYIAEASSIKKVEKDGGAVTTLATGLQSVQSLAVDSTSVYWGEVYGFAIKKVGINGGSVTTLASNQGNIDSIAIDSSSVYWTEGSIKKVGINGGAVTTLASEVGYKITVDPINAYWTQYGVSGAIKKVGINGGTVTDLATAGFASCIAVDAQSVYFSDSGYIKKVGINGGGVTSLTTSPGGKYSMVIDSTHVYWIERKNIFGGIDIVSLKKISINGGAETSLAAGFSDDNDYGLGVDSTHVYWTEQGLGSQNGGTLKKVPKVY